MVSASLLVCVKERYFTAAALSFLSPSLLLSSQQQRVHARRPVRVRRDHVHGQPPPPTLLLLCLLLLHALGLLAAHSIRRRCRQAGRGPSPSR